MEIGRVEVALRSGGFARYDSDGSCEDSIELACLTVLINWLSWEKVNVVVHYTWLYTAHPMFECNYP